MLNLREQKISALYVGKERIKKAYVGGELVFGGGETSRLPEGYTELQYIINNGVGASPNYYNGTGMPGAPNYTWHLTKRYEFTIDVSEWAGQLDASSTFAVTRYIFGRYFSYKSSSAAALQFNEFDLEYYYYQGISYVRLSTGSTAASWSAALDAGETILHIVIDFPKGYIYVNDHEYQAASAFTSATSNSNLNVVAILARNYRAYKYNGVNNTSLGGAGIPCKLFGLKVYNSTAAATAELAANFFPAKAADGTVGMYDLVNGWFYYAYDAANPFAPGPAV